MKKNELMEIKKMDIPALEERIKQIRLEMVDLFLNKSIGKINNTKSLKNKRRDLAQSLTILKQKQLLKQLEVKYEK